MHSMPLASLCFVVALAFAPISAQAQSIPSRLAALEAAVAALQTGQTTVQNNINAEAAARAAADTTLQNNINVEAAGRAASDTALQVQIDKLKGNIVPSDLFGTYAVHFVSTAMDGPPNQLTSYAIKGTVTLAAGNTGVATLTAAGIAWSEGTPFETWARQEVGVGIEFDFTWSYSNGTFSMASENDFGNSTLNVVAGGQVMVGVEGGAPSNNQLIVVWTRRP